MKTHLTNESWRTRSMWQETPDQCGMMRRPYSDIYTLRVCYCTLVGISGICTLLETFINAFEGNYRFFFLYFYNLSYIYFGRYLEWRSWISTSAFTRVVFFSHTYLYFYLSKDWVNFRLLSSRFAHFSTTWGFHSLTPSSAISPDSRISVVFLHKQASDICYFM